MATKKGSPGSVTNFIGQLTSEDSDKRCEAAQAIFAHFFERLVQIATANLAPQIRRREDEEEVALSAIKSFFLRQGEGQFVLESSNELLDLLAAITIRKVRSLARKHTADRRDVNREVQPDAEAGADSWLLEQMASREPTAEEAAVVSELINSLPSDKHKQLVLLRMEGQTDKEIAATLGCTGETVRLRRLRIGRIWEEADSEA